MTSKTTTTLRALLFLILCPLILIFAAPLAKRVSPSVGLLLVGLVASAFTFAVTVFFVRWDGISLCDVGAAPGARTLPRALFGSLVGLALVALQDTALYAGGHTHWVFTSPSLSPRVVLLALFGYLALALREELAYRGYPLRRLEEAWGLWPALILTSIVFTLEHTAGGWSWSQSLLGPPAGALLFGMAALATRSLAVPLGIHAAFNSGQWIMGQKETAGPFRLVVDPGFSSQTETIGYAAYLVGTIAAVIAFWLWHTRRNALRRQDQPQTNIGGPTRT